MDPVSLVALLLLVALSGEKQKAPNTAGLTPADALATAGPMPFGLDAGPLAGSNAAVLKVNGMVWAPYDAIILAGTDEDIWPVELKQLPPAERGAIILAQELITTGELACRVKGSCAGQDMANALKAPVRRSAHVAYHLWLAAMQARGGESALRQVPATTAEKAAMVAAHKVAEATILAPDTLVA